MSKMRIVNTTDHKYIGYCFDENDNPIILEDDISVYIDKKMNLSDGIRFLNSNYSIDAVRIGEE